MIRPIERVRYGIDWKDGQWAPRESAEFVVTRAAKVEGHWRPARVISAPMSYDSAVAVFGQLVEENAAIEHEPHRVKFCPYCREARTCPYVEAQRWREAAARLAGKGGSHGHMEAHTT